MRLPADVCADVACTDEYDRLSLRCAISFKRLRQPAKGVGCRHRSQCNYVELRRHASRTKRCPISGCTAQLVRLDDVICDEALRALLEGVPPEVCQRRRAHAP